MGRRIKKGRADETARPRYEGGIATKGVDRSGMSAVRSCSKCAPAKSGWQAQKLITGHFCQYIRQYGRAERTARACGKPRRNDSAEGLRGPRSGPTKFSAPKAPVGACRRSRGAFGARPRRSRRLERSRPMRAPVRRGKYDGTTMIEPSTCAHGAGNGSGSVTVKRNEFSFPNRGTSGRCR